MMHDRVNLSGVVHNNSGPPRMLRMWGDWVVDVKPAFLTILPAWSKGKLN